MSQAAHSNPAMRSATGPGVYTKPAVAIHWIITLLIFAVFGLGLYMTNIPGFTSTKLKLFLYHKWIGVIVLILVMLRILWRLAHPAPGPVPDMSRWQHAVTEVAHVRLYLLILVVPLTDYLLSVAADVKVVYLDL